MLRNYIKLALKVLARRKFFTFISLFGISMTLVVLMIATAILDNIVAPRAPESRFDRALAVHQVSERGERASRSGYAGYRFVDKHVRTLPGIERATVFSQPSSTVLYENGRKVSTIVRRTDGEYWRVMDFRFLEGTPFAAVDDLNGNRVAVISKGVREKLFDDANAVGRGITIDGDRFRIIGVVDDVSITRLAGFAEIWLPIGTAKSQDFRRNIVGDFGAVVLAKDKSDFPRLKRELAARVRTSETDDPAMFTEVRAGLDTTFEAVARMLIPGNLSDERRPMVMRAVLLLLALLFVTLPTMNLISINLSRIMERASEIGVRKAFGASSRKLVGQFVVENVVLTLIGGAIGFVLAVLALALLNRSGVIPYVRFDINFRVFLWAVAIAFLFGVFSGVYPAWKMSRMNPVNALRGGSL